MNSMIDWLNLWGARLVDFALPLLWQSSLLIAVILTLDFLSRRRVRAAVRYSLWFVVFLKLVLPPTLALPTGAAWWLRGRPAPVVAAHTRIVTVNYSEPANVYVPPAISFAPVARPAPKLSREGWILMVAVAVSGFLALWVLVRWRQIARCVRGMAEANVEIAELLAQAQQLAAMRREVRLRVTPQTMSPAVCGLFRPVILLPQSLIEKLTTKQLRAVLLHELIHLRRRDVWVNCAQTLLQIVYWWHPLLWVANARVRRVREEAVDDAVMCALNAEAEVYAPTLLEVAKLAFSRPLASLGLVGILESRSALRNRIERLLNFTTPRRAGVSVVSLVCLAAFTALAVPMGEPPARPAQAATDELGGEKLIPYRAKVDADVFARNIQARADGTMHGTNDDLNDILVSIMDGFGLDCTGERAIQFNRATGEVTTQSTGEALGVLDEVVRELNLKGGEHILNPHGLKQVLIEGQFYLMKPEELAKLQLTAESLHQDGELSPWWGLSPNDSTSLQQRLKEFGLKPLTSPKILTSHGVTAEMFFGDATNNLDWKCVPYVHDGMINFTVLARTTGQYAPSGKGWPDIAGHTNCAIFSRISVPNGGVGILRAEQAGANNDLVVLLTAKIVEPSLAMNAPIRASSTEVGRLLGSPSNSSGGLTNLYDYTFRLDDMALAQRLKDFAAEHQLKANFTNPPTLLIYFLLNAGVKLEPPQTFFYRQGALSMRATKENLRKTAEALGLNWETERALKASNTIDLEEIMDDSSPKVQANSAAGGSNIRQLVEDGKLLYQLGKPDEAEIKFHKVLEIDPKNQTALYYVGLIKQLQARDLQRPAQNLKDPPAGARAMNVPGPGTQANEERMNLPAPNLYARTNRVFTSPARQKLYEKLNSITFDKVSFNDETMREVVEELAKMTARRDSDQEGINYILNRTHPKIASETGATNAFDPATSQPITSPQNDIDLASVKVSINLKNVRLLDVLDTITKSADHAISYAILDYGIEFSLKGPDVLQLHTRTFRVDLNTFLPALEKVSQFKYKREGGNSVQDINLAVIGFFHAINVDLKAPKSLFFNERQGTLTVRATDDDLEMIQESISNLNTAPLQVTVKVRFVEVHQKEPGAQGFDWYLGNFQTANNKSGGSSSPQLSSAGAPGGTTPPPSGPNTLLTTGLRGASGSTAASLPLITGILTDPQFRVVLHALEQREGAKVLSEGQVTTLSGRQANFQMVDVKTVLNGLNAAVTNKATTYNYNATNMTFGTTLDVVPYVGADGYTIQMTVSPAVTEFLGYEDPKDYVKYDAKLKNAQLPLPKYRSRQTSMSATVWDGQTLVLGDLTDETIVSDPDGTKIRQPFNEKKKTLLLVFITPTIIDPSGNRVHNEETNASASPILGTPLK